MHVQQKYFVHANVVLDTEVSIDKLIPKGAPIAKSAIDIAGCIQKRTPKCAPLALLQWKFKFPLKEVHSKIDIDCKCSTCHHMFIPSAMDNVTNRVSFFTCI